MNRSKAFRPYINYANAAYCKASDTLSWTCENCPSQPTFQPVASGGEGAVTQYWYVGYDLDLATVVVGHQGTKTEAIIPVLIDANFIPGPLSQSLFPGISSSVEVHSGFRDSHSRSAEGVLAGVQAALAKYDTTSVTLTGHSLGAALALLDDVYLPLHLPPNTTFTTVAFGTPRVGNQAFADYVDANTNFTHVNNLKDIVPTVPPSLFGYHSASGEVHIDYPSGQWVRCSGQDNTDAACILGDVPNIFIGNVTNHLGPYLGVEFGCPDDT
ncbi:lipase [Punctularia strigosozonata HHB-11173 SS5]|uniref:lipase n=1 Tax=Punctularia strigosozonata (strain HHB-11173) TaxID=741275 RepID=UPI0004416E3F|nr:lipase [Punctularia strigosozonata HHB-11173 SS5]EIN06274.1 lipase [Punctularia strigosozonata HHB-11173 SS5]